MINSQDLLQQLAIAAAILGAILALLKALADLIQFLKPYFSPIIFLSSIIIPHGLIIWYWMYLAAINANRISEGMVFIYLIIQLTLLTSFYTFAWSKWLYPKIDLWQKSQSHNAQEKHEQKGKDTTPSDISE